MSAGLAAVGIAGLTLLAVVLADVLVTIFNYDGFTFLTARLHRVLWSLLRKLGAMLPGRGADAVLRFGSAAMLPATLATWLALEVSAFALMYLPGLYGGSFSRSGHPHGALGTALYLSAGDISSLTFGDVVPRTGMYQAVVDLETIVGLATVGLAVTYVLSALDAVRSLNRLHSRVRRQTTRPNRPETILAAYFDSGQPAELSALLQALADDLENYDQDLRRYPVVFYFHTLRVDRSIPRVFAALGHLIELIRWGLPASERLTRQPSLLAVADEYMTVISRLQRSFVGPSGNPPIIALPEPEFWREYERGLAGDTHVGEFRRLIHQACLAAGLDNDPASPGAETYRRYRDWIDFHVRRHAITERVSVALGYGRRAADSSAEAQRCELTITRR